MKSIEVRESLIHGLGVFAAEAITEGRIVLAIDDNRILTSLSPLVPLNGEYDCHCEYLQNGRVVLMQYPERHINHRCRPNTFVRTVSGVRCVLALKHILPGDEITNDYCINGGGDTLWICNCGDEECRLRIHSNYFHIPLDLQIEYFPLLDDWYVDENRESVEQMKATMSSS